MGEPFPTSSSTKSSFYQDIAQQTGSDQFPHYVRSIGLGVIAMLIGLQLSGWIGFALSDLRYHTDFPFYYRGAMVVRTGNGSHLYTPYLTDYGYTHPAFEALLFTPFTIFPFVWAYLIWMAMNIGFLVMSHRLLAARLLANISPLGSMGILAAFFPVSFAVMNGEDSILLLLLACWSFTKLRSGHPIWSGLILGCGVFRFQFVVPFLVLMTIWKLYRVTLGACLSGGILTALSVAVTGWKQQITYYYLLRDLSHHYYPGTMSNLRTLLLHAHATAILLPLSLLLFIVIVWMGKDLAPPQKFLISATTVCVLNYHQFAYDLCVLALPLLIFTRWLLEQQRYRELLLPLAILVIPTAVLMIGGATQLWLCGILPLILVFHMLLDWNQSSFTASQLGQSFLIA